MKAIEIKDILIQRGYNENSAELVANDLVKIDSNLVEALDKWLTEEKETEVECQGVSLKGIMQQYKMKYPAALLSIDWIYKEPEVALLRLKSK